MKGKAISQSQACVLSVDAVGETTLPYEAFDNVARKKELKNELFVRILLSL